MQKLVRNVARCGKCNTVIESRHRHDFVWCECKAIFTDGGTDYIRRGGDLEAMIDLSEFVEVES
jgi:hypothetical protein